MAATGSAKDPVAWSAPSTRDGTSFAAIEAVCP